MSNTENNTLPNISLEQQNIINLLQEQNNVIVESVAGSGKTTTNLYIAKSFPESNILLLTYNAKLKIETRNKIISLNIKNIETHSYHSFCVKYYNDKAYTDTEIINILANNNKINKIINYDIIILDELQDISPLYYKLICKIFKDNNTKAKICILGDRYQTIYDFKGADSRYIIYASKLFNYNSYNWISSKLSQSYRITFEMSEFINKCLLKEDRIISHKISHNKPQYIICNVFNDTINNSVFIQVKKYLSLGYKPTDIFILAPSIKGELNPARILENLIKQYIIDIPVYVPSSDDEKLDSDILKNKLVFSTFHQSKGLERKIVIVYNFDDSYFKFFNKDKNPLLCPNEYYVATTRSLEHLILIHHHKNNYFQFVNISNLKIYCDIHNHKTIDLQKEDMKDTHITTVTQLIKYLPEEILNHCISCLKIIEINKKEAQINIPIKIKTKYGYENVSDISGTLIPALYQYKTTGEMKIYDEALKGKITTHVDLINFIDSDSTDNDIIKPIKTYNLDNINIKKENIDELLYISNYYISYRDGYLFKLYQIEDYDWITKDNLDLSCDRLSKFISNDAIYEYYIECEPNINKLSRPELLNRRLVGHIDCIDNDKIYEFKCVHKLESEHYLQLALYMYLYETKNREEIENEYNTKLSRYNSRISKYLNLIESNNETFNKLKRKTKKMINKITLENDKYNKKIQYYTKKIESLNNKLIINHIITNKYYLYNILSNEMQQIICNYNELVSIVEYLIKFKYLNKKQVDDDNFIKNNNKFYDEYFLSIIEQNKEIMNNNDIYKTYESNKIVLDIETDAHHNILQIAYNMYDNNNILICSKDFYVYDGIHSKPYYPTINEKDIIKYGISLKDTSDIITKDINNTNILIGHNIKSFDLVHINKLNNKFNNKIKDTLIIHDTMISSKNIINAKNKIGRLKNPRLDEMLMFLCNKSVEDYHNALGDITATFDCYKILCDKYKCF